MPKSVPLRTITVRMLDPAMPSAASSVALPAAIDRFRKKWSLRSMNSKTSAARSRSGQVRTIAGVTARKNSDVPARLRLWHSSPMCSAWPMRETFPLIDRRTRPCAAFHAVNR